MMKINTVGSIIFLVLLFVSDAFCLNVSEVTKEIESDFEVFFAVSPTESEAILNKYRKGISIYEPVFEVVLKNRKYDDEITYDVIYFTAILKKDGRFIENVKKMMPYASADLKDAISFYFYRIGYEKDSSLSHLKKRIDFIVAHPIDSYIITFIPFIDNLDLSLSYLDRLSKKADGAMGELIHWSIGYLHYMNRENVEAIKKIEKSYSYKLHIQKSGL